MTNRRTPKAAVVSKIESLENRQLMSVVYGANLIQNPGAETYQGDANGYSIITPDDWTAGGYPTVIQYGHGYANVADVRTPNNGGNAFFAGGPYSRSDDFYQGIDLSSISSAINAGQVNFTLVAAIGGRGTDNDTATVSIHFLNASGDLISTQSTPTPSRHDRSNRSKFVRESRTDTVPVGTVTAQIQLHFQRYDGLYNDGYVDNLSLVVATNTPSFSGVTPSVVKSTLNPDSVTGKKVAGKLTIDLTNTSTSINTGLDAVSVYASSDGAIDSTSVLLGTVKHQLAIDPGRFAEIPFTVKGLVLPAGDYTILARASDYIDTIVTAATGPLVAVSAPVVSLSGQVGAVTPAATLTNNTISFTLTLSNTGNIDSTGLATITIGLSSAGSSLDTVLTTLTKRLTIKAGGTPVVLHLKAKIPTTQPAGVFDPVVTFMQGSTTLTVQGIPTVTVVD